MEPRKTTKLRVWLCLFMLGLILSGLTAFPLESELKLLDGWLGSQTTIERHFPALSEWISRVHVGIAETNRKYPFIAYGTDWLAFAHLIIAVLFIGPLVNPVKNVWVVDFGILACIAVVPFAMVCGHFRGIPVAWRVVDCSFGIFGLIPLLVVRRAIRIMEANLGRRSPEAASAPSYDE